MAGSQSYALTTPNLLWPRALFPCAFSVAFGLEDKFNEEPVPQSVGRNVGQSEVLMRVTKR